ALGAAPLQDVGARDKPGHDGEGAGMMAQGGMTARETSSREERGAVIPDGAAESGSQDQDGAVIPA
ncbi:hypothetical protein, partial [Microvirga zambiensis]|uniref:hypothetical protein n=1 Tax=Microvirga zambiensis TaxID=1402137 RepID=UPI001AEFBA06